MDHPNGPFSMVRFNSPLRAPAYSGLPLAKGERHLMVALTLRPEHQRTHAVPNHYFLIRPCIRPNHVERNLRMSFLSARGVRNFTPRQVAGILTTPNLLYRILVEKCRVPAWYCYGELFYFAEQVPNRDSRVSLSLQSRDASRYPIASIHWQPLARDTHSLSDFARAVLSRGFNSKQYHTEPDEFAGEWTEQYTSAAHHLGTARMASDPSRGVVNTNLQVFGIDNLYVCDGSVFVTSGSANPSLTITALALRLGDHLLSKSAW
jgi:choline dehydrogenase-like flavoprotein